MLKTLSQFVSSSNLFKLTFITRMSLNDLFVQILQSEQKAKERKNLLNEVKNEIVSVQEQLKKVQEECISTQGQLVVKLHQQTEAELSLVWSRRREVILTDQLAQVTKNKDASAKELRSLEAVLATEHENFIQEMDSFNQTHDLCGRGKEQREAEARQHLRELKQQEQCLLAELSDYRKTQATRWRLSAEKTELEAEIDKLQGTLQGLHKQLEQKRAITKKLDGVKGQVASQPQDDTEFLRLRSKLDACHDEGLEAMCHALQQEVERLQRQHWQEQLQRQSNQASTSSTSSSAHPRSRNNGSRKAQKQQVLPNTPSFSNQSQSVNTWSSFHVTHSTQQIPSPQDAASITSNQQVHLPPTELGTNHRPPASGAVTQSTTAVSVKEELPLQPGRVDKPNLAKLRRGIENRETEKSERPATIIGTRQLQFHFRQSTPDDRQKSLSAGPNQPFTPNSRSATLLSNNRSDDQHDGDSSGRPNSSGLEQVSGNAKKVRFKY